MPKSSFRRSKAGCLGFPLLILSLVARSADWESLGRNESIRADVFVDASSIAVARDLVTGQMLVNLDAPRAARDNPTANFRSAVLHYVADCAANTVGVVQETDFTDLQGKGTAVFISTRVPSPRMDPLTATSPSAPFFRYACNYSAQAKAIGMPDAARGGAPQISEEEWASYENAPAVVCGADPGNCLSSPMERRNNFLYSHWPVPQATAQELAQPCRDNDDFWANDKVRKYANTGENAQRGGGLLAYWVGNWAGHHFPDRAYDQRGPSQRWCSDDRFKIVQWQRAVGLPQTGKISNADVDDFVNRWAPVILRLNQIAQVSNAKAEAEARVKAQVLDERRRQREQREAELYENGPTVFGVRVGRPWQESLPACQLRMVGLDNYEVVTDRTCFVASNSTLYFAGSDRPAWMAAVLAIKIDKTPRTVSSSTIKVELDQLRVVGMKFLGQQPAVMVSELDGRFGSHKTQESEYQTPAKRVCMGFEPMVQCVDVPSGLRRETSYTWAKDGLVVSTSDVNVSSFDVAVTYEAYAKVKAIRAEAAALEQQQKPVAVEPDTRRRF